jgi:hypothetical protein
MLGEIGWESVVSANGEPEGLCVPLNLQKFLSVSNETKIFKMRLVTPSKQ